MLKFNRSSESGDTIVEVLLAMSILTLILFTSWGLVNRSTQLSLAARQRIDMVNQMKEQAEILKSKFAETGSSKDITDYLSGTQPGQSAVNNAGSDYADTGFCIDDVAGLGNGNRFYFNETAQYVKPGIKDVNGDPTAKIWIEYSNTDDTQTTGPFVDFYVRGCWLTNGGRQKTDNAQFIVRLNE